MVNLLDFNSISKKINGKILFKDVSFSLKKGTITTLVGQNGSGKTTLARIILGLDKHDSGKYKIDKNISVAYVPQLLKINKYVPLKVDNFLKILSPNYDKKLLTLFNDFINFDKIKNSDITDLSGGELQKIMLISALIKKCDLLILDEPVQYLDLSSQQEFYLILKKFKKDFNTTIFMISHDLFTVMKNSDQVICLNGHVCCSGKPEDIKSNKILQNALSEIGIYIHSHDHKH